uniref:immunoglobulin-like and fibronectin type III domain-containing protein 1.1 n=1 Tax=Monopterus albus TaxID=43700 RepID=UPI0009B368C3|nr:immunoglobulin-like and fibronectin type III domain-containing protein 1 [Monopterus albus]
MWKKSTKVTDQTATGQAVGGSEGVHPDDKGIRKKSKVPGVTITQFMEELPEGMSTPDFTRKPIALTIQEGKFAVFKAKVAGTPTPTVSWSRANGEIFFHPEVCLQKYNQSSQEHTLEFPKVAPEDADTYKCFATNEYGRALCTVVLNVIEVGFSKTRELQKAQREDAAELRKKLKKCNPDGTWRQKSMEPDEKVWEILLSADKKDYERICLEYGITDFRGMLRKLIRMKSEREKEIAEFIKHIGRLKHIEVNDNGYATIELDMDLKDPSSKIFLYKDGGMVPFSLEDGKGMRHSLKQVDKRYIFTIKNLIPEDAGLYSVDVGSVNVFSTYFKIPEVDFAFKIQEVKAEEREDALFQCVLTAPMNEIKWFGKQALLSDCEKYKIIASEDKLIHKLIVQDCMPLDAGIYSAVAGINSCSAWLVVEADKDDANMGKKAARKTTMAGGGNDEDLMRIAKEQGERYRKKMEENRTIAKNAAEARKAAVQAKKEAATKAVAEAKDEAAARSNREADGKDGAAGKAKTKDTSAAGGGGSTANSAEGTGSTRGDGGALGACGGGTDTGTGIGIRDGAASGVGEQAGAAGDRTGARGEAGGRGGGGAVVIARDEAGDSGRIGNEDRVGAGTRIGDGVEVEKAAGVGIGGRAGAGAAAGEGAGIGRRAGTGTGVGEGAEGAIRGGDGVGEGAGAGGAIRGGAGVGIAGIAGTGFGEGAGVGIGGRAGAGTVAGMGEGAGIGRRAGTGAGESAGVGIGGGAGGAIRGGAGVGVGDAVGIGALAGTGAGVGVGEGPGVGIEGGAGAGTGAGIGVGEGVGIRGRAGTRTVAGVGEGAGVGIGGGAGVGEGVGIGGRAGTGTIAGVGEGAGVRIGGGAGVAEGGGIGIRGGVGTGTAAGMGEGAGVGIGAGIGVGEGGGIGGRAGTRTAAGVGEGAGGGAAVGEGGGIGGRAGTRTAAEVGEGAGVGIRGGAGVGTAAGVGEGAGGGAAVGEGGGIGGRAGTRTAAEVGEGAGVGIRGGAGVGTAAGVGEGAGVGIGAGIGVGEGGGIGGRAGIRTAAGVGEGAGVGIGGGAGVGEGGRIGGRAGARTVAGVGEGAGEGIRGRAIDGTGAGVGFGVGAGVGEGGGFGGGAAVGEGGGIGGRAGTRTVAGVGEGAGEGIRGRAIDGTGAGVGFGVGAGVGEGGGFGGGAAVGEGGGIGGRAGARTVAGVGEGAGDGIRGGAIDGTRAGVGFGGGAGLEWERELELELEVELALELEWERELDLELEVELALELEWERELELQLEVELALELELEWERELELQLEVELVLELELELEWERELELELELEWERELELELEVGLEKKLETAVGVELKAVVKVELKTELEVELALELELELELEEELEVQLEVELEKTLEVAVGVELDPKMKLEADVKVELKTDLEVELAQKLEMDLELEQELEQGVELRLKPKLEWELEMVLEPEVELELKGELEPKLKVELELEPELEGELELKLELELELKPKLEVEVELKLQLEPDLEIHNFKNMKELKTPCCRICALTNLLVDKSTDPGVHFQSGLSDCKAIIGEAAELECKLSSEDSTGIWYKDGNEIKSSAGITISKEGSFHRLKIHKVSEKSAGKYKFEAEGQKTEALIIIEDPPRFDAEDLKAFKTPVTVKKGHKATFKISYTGQEPIKVSWFLEGEELSDSGNIKIEFSEGYGRLLLNKLQRKDSGEVKVKLKNECGAAEAISQLVVLDKPTPPLGPLEIVEATASAAEFKWRPPKDNGGCKISNYVLERQQVGRNTWKKIGPIGPEAQYRDTNVDRGKKYCYRIRAETEVGTSELMETENIQAGTKAYPGSPSAPKVVSASKECITLSWSPPSDTGGTSILGYNLEKRKKGGSSMWGLVNPHDEMIRAKEFAVKDVIDGMEYEFRVSAINTSGAGEYSTPSEFVFARDPKKSPGKVTDLKVTDSTYTSLSLSWTKPKQTEYEDEAQGYFVEVRPAESTIWERCNLNAITMTSYTVKGIKSLGMYWVRVIAVNNGGQGQPQELDRYILAMPPPVRPRFTDSRTKSFIIVKAGNSARFSIKYEASPWPEITWLKDGMPVTKNVLISNTETISQLLIPSSERSHSGIYTIIIKNAFGHATFSTEIRVTDDPKPPGPVEIEEKVPGTVTLSWTSSPDEKRDDRLNYMVTKCDSVKGIWQTVADNIFNNKFTDCDIMPGREYKFRVYAKNEMGSSKPSESPKWLISTKKEKFTVKMPESKACDLQCPPKFLVPLKMHTAPDGYECFMSCAITGDPTPHVTWLRNNISLNTDTNYYISNTCGVCSMLILKVGTKDTGEYKVVAENNLGRAECATQLSVRE